MAKKPTSGKRTSKRSAKTAKKPKRTPSTKSADAASIAAPAGKPSSLLDTRVIYCGDCLEKLADLPDNCVDLTS